MPAVAVVAPGVVLGGGGGDGFCGHEDRVGVWENRRQERWVVDRFEPTKRGFLKPDFQGSG